MGSEFLFYNRSSLTDAYQFLFIDEPMHTSRNRESIHIQTGVDKSVLSAGAEGECGAGWTHYGSSCYLLKLDPALWTEAKVICNAVHGHLVEIGSAEENNFLKNLLHDHNVSRAWMGLEDFVVEGEFVWTTSQETPKYTNWDVHQPDDAHSGEDCGEITITGKWNDGPCEGIHHRFICETE
ncbi:hypothetical protein BaRGS_00008624 [Batillaria attramentaria]|uniref:C-type lectin domain-containing protein n=1 Tax=Batillaria attramentaria TaxID=370345 RepID=A0ABD0LL63_9CAEN